jgi:hypothetical protein
VSLVAAAIERVGIPTVAMVFLREVAEKIGPPRAMWLPYQHGYPLGKPNDPALQRAVLEAALTMLGEQGPPPVLRDFLEEERRVVELHTTWQLRS